MNGAAFILVLLFHSSMFFFVVIFLSCGVQFVVLNVLYK